MNLRLLILLFFPIFASAQEQFSVFFESNKFELAKEQSDRLTHWIKDNPTSKIIAINGYTDEDGTAGFNDTLAKKRVANIFKEISGKVKIRDDFKTRSFGEQHKLSAVKAENRKVTIFYLLEKDIARENEILGIKAETALKVRTPRNYPQSIFLENPEGTKTQIKLDTIFMKQVDQAKAGEKLKVENLNFQINTFIVMPESRSKLYELLFVLRSNPDLKIEIQGHLCCMPNDRYDLSTKRAKAVHSFLLANEIPKSQLSFKGFGSTQPLFPIPEANEAQRAANRRVEILIVEN